MPTGVYNYPISNPGVSVIQMTSTGLHAREAGAHHACASASASDMTWRAMHLHTQHRKPHYKESTNKDLNEEDKMPRDIKDPAPEKVDVEDVLTFGITVMLDQRESKFQ